MTGGIQHEPRTTDLLRTALDTHPGDQIALGEFLDPLGERAFGFLLLALALPNFIPVPTGIGGVMGVLVVLVGLQMLLVFLAHDVATVPMTPIHPRLYQVRILRGYLDNQGKFE